MTTSSEQSAPEADAKSAYKDRYARVRTPSGLNYVPQSPVRHLLYVIFAWMTRGYWELRPSVRERQNFAQIEMKRSLFYARKVNSFLTLKGGIGKTTLAKLFGDVFKMTRKGLNVLVQDCNRDRGTLGDRGPRTTRFAVLDLVRDIAKVKSLADFARYCNETVHGTLILASTHDGEYSGVNRMTGTQFDAVDAQSENFFQLVAYDLGTSFDSATNVHALMASDCVVVPTTPAKDSINQAKQTYGWLFMDPADRTEEETQQFAGRPIDFRDVARNSILVVNRRWPWTSLKRMRAKFAAEFGPDFDHVLVMGVGVSLKLSLGANIDPMKVRRGVRTDIMELVAAFSMRVRDAVSDDPNSQLAIDEAAVSPVRRSTSEGESAADLLARHGSSVPAESRSSRRAQAAATVSNSEAVSASSRNEAVPPANDSKFTGRNFRRPGRTKSARDTHVSQTSQLASAQPSSLQLVTDLGETQAASPVMPVRDESVADDARDEVFDLMNAAPTFGGDPGTTKSVHVKPPEAPRPNSESPAMSPTLATEEDQQAPWGDDEVTSDAPERHSLREIALIQLRRQGELITEPAVVGFISRLARQQPQVAENPDGLYSLEELQLA